MTRDDFGFVGQGQKAGCNRVHDLVEIAAGQVGSANAAGKKGVACDDHFERKKVEADGALRVARGVENLGGVGVEAHAHSFHQALVGRGRLRGLNAQPRGLRAHHLEERQVILVQQDRGTGEAFELDRAAHVVNVGVGDEDLLELEAQLGEAAVDAADFVAGVDDDGLARSFVAQNGAVALQRADGKGLKDHDFIVERYGPRPLG